MIARTVRRTGIENSARRRRSDRGTFRRPPALQHGFAAIDRARELLREGGTVGVADFHVSRKHPSPGRARHGWWTRTFWPAWFAMDDVFLDAERVEYLHARFRPERFEERLAKVPFLPGARVPRYEFVGRKAMEQPMPRRGRASMGLR